METAHTHTTSHRPITAYIAEDSGAVRDRIAELLASGGRISIVGQSPSAKGAIEGILSARPDAVVLDIQLQGGSGLEVIRAVRAQAPEIAFVILTGHPNPRYRMAFAQEGARAFLDKCSEFEQITTEILAARTLRESANPTSSSDVH
jgi:DNA-binding NarL/FixJ family response regulator